MLLRFRLMRVAARGTSFLAGGAVALTAWLVLAANSETRDARNLSVPHERLWSGPAAASEDSLSILTHGSWLCPNAECRYRTLAGGAPFRSAVPQSCTLCRSALIQEEDLEFFQD